MDFDENLKPEDVVFFKKDIVFTNLRDSLDTEDFELLPLVREDAASGSCMRCKILCQYFPRGFPEDDDNYIALQFQLLFSKFQFKLRRWSCVVSVVSTEDQPKFSQSMIIGEDLDWDFSFEENLGISKSTPYISYPQFIERRVLLDDDQEYLSGDTLKLRCEMEVHFEVNNDDSAFKWALEQQHFIYERDTSVRLNLGSPIYSSLQEESPFFEGMLRSHMQETDRQWMHIYDDVYAFADMLYFIETRKLGHVCSASSLLNLYVISDKYLISNLKPNIRRLIIKSLTIGTAAVALSLAFNCNDEELKNSCSDFIRSLSLEELHIVKNELSSMSREDIIEELFRSNLASL